MANPSILAAFERMCHHIVNALGSKSDIGHNHNDQYYTKAEIDAKYNSVRVVEINLPAKNWYGASGLYSQIVHIDGITEYSQVDLRPSIDQLAIFHNKDIAFVTENNDGVVTVFVLGDKPINDYTIQAAITEVEVWKL